MTQLMKVYTSQIEKLQKEIYQVYSRARADDNLTLVEKLELSATIRNIGQVCKNPGV